MVVATSCSNKDTSDTNTVNSNSDSIIFDKGIDPNAVVEDVVRTDSCVIIEDIEDDVKTIEPVKPVSNKYIEELKESIESANLSCPMDMGIFIKIEKMCYDENSNIVQFHYLINESYTPLTNYATKQAKESLKITLFQEPSRTTMEEIIKAKAGLQLIYKGSESNKTKKINLSYSELKEAYNNPINENEKNLILLENQIAIENGTCPITVSEGMIMDKVYDNGSYVIYCYKLDEDIYSVSNFAAPEVKQNLIALLDDPTVNQIMNLMIKNNRGVIYRYYGATSNERVDIKFTVSELKRHL